MRLSGIAVTFAAVAGAPPTPAQAPQPVAPGGAAANPTSDETSQRLDALTEEVARLHARLDSTQELPDSSMSGPTLTLKGFGHVQGGFERVDSEDDTQDETSDGFALGALDLFINSQVSDRISFLNETVFEPSSGNETVLDVERLLLKYDFDDRFNLQVGRFHSTIGYWNEAFHHGEWLQTSIDRPAILHFEDDDGLLPVHTIGLLFKGRHDCAMADVDYTVECGNGRGRTPDPPQISGDNNEFKSINLALGIAPSKIEGLRFGANGYFDHIPRNQNASDGPLHASLDERIVGAFVTWFGDQWEVMAEGFNIRHGGHGPSATSNGYYLQVSRKAGDFTPYVRYDALDLDDADRFFTSVDDRDTIAVGVRWDVSDWNAVKLQLSWTEVNGANSGPGARIPAVTVQTAFVF